MRRLVAVAAFALMMGTISTAHAQPNVCNGIDVNDGHATDGADFLTGSAGRDVIALGDGNDQYFAADGGDILCGNNGDDLLVGEGGNDEMSGGADNDNLVGMAGADQLTATLGADTLNGGPGADILNAGFVDGMQDDIYDGPGSDKIVGNAEDVWHKCDDGTTEDHDAFDGTIVPASDCGTSAP